jgi:hypothetical protein
MHDPRDAADFDEASYEVDYAGYCDREHRLFPDEPVREYRRATEALIRTLNIFVTFFVDHGYSRSKTLWGVAFALGHPITAGRSMLSVARELGCTKQAVSKVACDFLTETGLPPSPALKSEEAKETYRQTNGNRRTRTTVNA